MLRLRSNCTVICVDPSTLEEVICVTPGTWENWYSRGCATADAIVSGLAPGSRALTESVGKSTCGSGATGSIGKATSPTRRIPAISNDVATGLFMNGVEMLTSVPRHLCYGRWGRCHAVDANSRLQPILVAGHDTLPVMNCAADDGERAVRPADL